MEKKSSITSDCPAVNIPPREIIISYILTTIRRDWGIYGEKIFLNLLEYGQNDIHGVSFKDGCYKISPSFDYGENVTFLYDGDALVRFKLSDFFTDKNSKNYSYLKNSIKKMQQQIVEWEVIPCDKNGNPLKDRNGDYIIRWTSVQMLQTANIEFQESGYVVIRVNKNIWDALTDFSKGFRCIDLNIVNNLESKYSIRFYELMSRQKNDLRFGIDKLRSLLCVEDKYSLNKDFIKKVIRPAQKELNEKSPYGFTFDVVKSGRKFDTIVFHPKHILKNDTNYKSMQGVDETFLIDDNVRRYMKESYGFSLKQISSLSALLLKAQELMDGNAPDLYQLLVNLRKGAMDADDPQKYVIGALKLHLKEQYGFIYTRDKRHSGKRTPAVGQNEADTAAPCPGRLF